MGEKAYDRKTRLRAEARTRQAERDKRPPSEQIRELDRRGRVAAKERARLAT